MLSAIASLLLVGGPPERPNVDLHLDPCMASRAAAKELEAEIEFRLGYGIEIDGVPHEWTTKVELRCVSDGGPDPSEGELWIYDPISGTQSTRRFPLGDTHFADVVADSLRATWAQVARPARRDSIPRTVTRRVRRISRRPAAPWEFDDGPAVLAFVDGPVMFGEVTRVLHRPTRHLAWSADGVLSYRGQPTAGGRLRTLTISLAPSLLAWTALGPIDLYAGPGLRGGFVRMWGLPDDPGPGEAAPRLQEGSDSGYWLGPTVVGRIAGHPSKRIGLAAHVEGGWTVIPVRELGRGTFDLELDGAWILASVELVTSF